MFIITMSIPRFIKRQIFAAALSPSHAMGNNRASSSARTRLWQGGSGRPTLSQKAPLLESLYTQLNDRQVENSFDFEPLKCAAPLPRAYHWAGVSTVQARDHIQLIGLVKDVSLRNLIPGELGKQFGFYQSKPWTSFTPVLATPDELGEVWDGFQVHLPLSATLNGQLVGAPNAGFDMQDGSGSSIFGKIDQRVTQYSKPLS